jgi:plastocyanin
LGVERVVGEKRWRLIACLVALVVMVAGTASSAVADESTPPSISSFSPASGPAGTVVTIVGAGFTGATAVSFGGAAATFTVDADTQISATVPAAAVTGSISLTTPGGTTTSTNEFVVLVPPSIASFSPASGTVGAAVTISGSHLTGATAVSFGGVAASVFNVDSDAQLSATVPAGAATGRVAVTGPGGTGTSTTDFVVVSAPSITSLSPDNGPVGSVVSIGGSNFTGATAVSFSGVAAVFSVDSDTQISATVPTAAVTGPVAVTGRAGTATSSGAFTVTNAHLVKVADFAFTPAATTAAYGETVRWQFAGPSTQTVTDSSGVGLFDSGPRGPGSVFDFTVPAAGTYAYTSTPRPDMRGSIAAALAVSPTAGTPSTSFQITWALTAPPSGTVFDVEVQSPGTSSFVAWRTGVTTLSDRFSSSTNGTFVFHARIRNAASGFASGWSPPASLFVDNNPSSRFLTLLFGRTQWVTTARCVRMANTVSLNEIADEFRRRGLIGTGAVILDRTKDTSQYCYAGFSTYPTWTELATLRDSYGWQFVSAGKRYTDVTKLSPADQQDVICGSLPAFAAHGFTRAWGLFAYPNNKRDQTVQANVTSKCFSYGRTYSGGTNCRTCTASPWFQRTNSVNGGACNNSALPCYSYKPSNGSPHHYTTPQRLAAMMNVPTGSWTVIQMYRFVTGARSTSSGGFSWDCTSTDSNSHWTSQGELYCWTDYLYALDSIPTTVRVTDPATVAEMWSRRPPA